MKKLITLIRKIVLCYLLFFSSSILADIVIPTFPGEKYDPEILLPALGDELKNTAFLTALEVIWSATGELSEDVVSGDVLFYIQDWINRPGNAEWLAKKAYGIWGSEIDGIFMNQLSTDEEKAAQLVLLIGKDIVDYFVLSPEGINLKAKYAPNFRAYKLIWERDQYSKLCVDYGLYLEAKICESNQCYDQIFGWWVYYGDLYTSYTYGITSIDEFFYEPDYKVYRVVDDNEKLITTIKGYRKSANWMSPSDIWVELVGSGVDIPENSLVVYDYDSDLVREKRTSLGYKVVATTENYDPWCASGTNVSTSIITTDSNMDGDPDFVPWHVLHKDVMATLIVVNSLLLM